VVVDLGAIGKGFAIDQAVAVLRACGVQSAMINAGGSTYYGMGSPPGDSGWLVHLCDPSARIDPHVRLHENSVSTSQQTPPGVLGMSSFGHIIDVVAGKPSTSATAVSVVAESATASDALSTAFLLMDPTKSRELVKKSTRLAVAWIDPGGLPQTVTSGPEIRMRSAEQINPRETLARNQT